MASDDVWWGFVRQCADDLLAGQLTSKQLRQALKDPHLLGSASHHDFRRSVIKICEDLSENATATRSLMLEIDAADRRFQQLASQRRKHANGASRNSLSLRFAQ